MKKTIITSGRSIEIDSNSKRVFIPLYSGGEKGRTMDYGIMCMRDSLDRVGEAPVMPDLAYIQCINESDNAEMSRAGIASNEWLKGSEKLVLYIDRGISMAMNNIFMICSKMSKEIEFRTLSRAEDKLSTVNMLNSNVSNIGSVSDIFDKINKKKKSNLISSLEHGDYFGGWSEACSRSYSLDNKRSIIEKIATREAILSMNEAPIAVHLMLIGNEESVRITEKKFVGAWGYGDTSIITLTTGDAVSDSERTVNINEFGYEASILREINKECVGTTGIDM